jgi:hypothetical protein
MGMWIRHEHQTFYKEGGRMYDTPQKRVEYDPETRTPIGNRAPLQPVPEPEREETTNVLGATREELEGMSIQDIYREYNLKPRAGYTKQKLIDEILGATD